ncbi:unnamed protein product [Larinioides sclopetarius]|uniref:Uncharacterized protein n=1 Tax=Larinioides sclopetarius TaxID=280406 RepID=A0AAV2B8W7_9ARAC
MFHVSDLQNCYPLEQHRNRIHSCFLVLATRFI